MQHYRCWIGGVNGGHATIVTRDGLQKLLREGKLIQVSEIGQKQPINFHPQEKFQAATKIALKYGSVFNRRHRRDERNGKQKRIS